MTNLKCIRRILLVILFANIFLLPVQSSCQFTAAMGAGVSSLGVPMANVRAGYAPTARRFGKEKTVFVYFNLDIPIAMQRSDVAGIMGVHTGYNIGSFQPVIGYNYHLASYDKVNYEMNGWKWCYGLTKYFKDTPLFLSVVKNGKPIIATGGVYKVF